MYSIICALADEFGVDLDKPWRELLPKQQLLVLFGVGVRRLEVKWESKNGAGSGSRAMR